jgi:hypothetical protein
VVRVPGPARVSGGDDASIRHASVQDPEETVTEPHDPEDTPTRAEDEHPSSSGGEGWSTSPADPPTEPGWARSEVPAAPSAEPSAEPAGPPRPSWWRSRRVRVGAVGTLAALVLLGGGFGAGYAVADASAPPAAHVAAAKGHARKGAQGVRKRRQQEQQGQGAVPPPATIPG